MRPRLGSKLLSVTNALAYYSTELIMTVKCFIIRAQGGKFNKKIELVNYSQRVLVSLIHLWPVL
jgi:hypothetical protein